MPRVAFDSLPDDSRLWVFGAARPLTADEQARVAEVTADFIDGWQAHGTPLRGGFTLVDDTFLVVAVDQASVPPSGCSIDAMVRVLKGLQAELGIDMLTNGQVHLRDDAGIRRVSRAEFGAGVEAGRFTPETRVFDTTLTALGRFRGGAFEHAARDGWHGVAFFRNLAARD